MAADSLVHTAEAQTSSDLRKLVAAEKRRERAERGQMAIEDIRSALPPLSDSGAPRLIKANAHTLWVAWTAPEQDADGKDLAPETQQQVRYHLYAYGGYEPLRDGLRVKVKCPVTYEVKGTPTSAPRVGGEPSTALSSFSAAASPASPASPADGGISTQSPGTVNSELSDEGGNLFSSSRTDGGPDSPTTPHTPKSTKKPERWVLSRGEIVRPGKLPGTFSISFDDGSYEADVPRSRLRLENPDADNPLLKDRAKLVAADTADAADAAAARSPAPTAENGAVVSVPAGSARPHPRSRRERKAKRQLRRLGPDSLFRTRVLKPGIGSSLWQDNTPAETPEQKVQ
jgi:hypothetical protein